jgi:hypothetical protein
MVLKITFHFLRTGFSIMYAKGSGVWDEEEGLF